MAATETSDAVSLWWGDLETSRVREDDAAILSPAELERAARFASWRDRDRFVAAHGQLRRLLGSLLRCPPGEVELAEAEGGKPAIPGSSLRFSASRSAGVALFATSWTMEVGVDLERVVEGREVEAIAARFFTDAERQAIAELPEPERMRAAFECWSCKEAYVKGTGKGVTADLASLPVWSPGSASTTVGAWRVVPLDLDPGFGAAVAGNDPGQWRPGPLRRL